MGTGKELLASELPTNKDLLRLGVLLKEECDNTSDLSAEQLAKEIQPHLNRQWSKANALFVPPVTNHDKTVLPKLRDLWQTATKIARGKASRLEKERLDSKLDRLFDILTCKCPIRSCEEWGCSGCNVGAHISCSCSKDKKIPVCELQYIKDQREKVGSKGQQQISTVDRVEHGRQVRAKKRIEKREEAEQKRKEKVEKAEARCEEGRKEAERFLASDDKETEDDDDDAGTRDASTSGGDPPPEIEESIESKSMPPPAKKQKRNYDDIPTARGNGRREIWRWAKADSCDRHGGTDR